MKTWGFACTILEQLGNVSSILGACNLGAKNQRFVYICVEEKFELFVNYDEWLQQSTNPIMRL